MEFEDFKTNLASDALAIKQLIMELSECADERYSNTIHAVKILTFHQLYLLERMTNFLKK